MLVSSKKFFVFFGVGALFVLNKGIRRIMGDLRVLGVFSRSYKSVAG